MLKMFKALIVLAVIYALISNFIVPIKYDDIIEQEAAKNNVSPYMIAAIIKAESNFNPRALSHKGAKGLMQLMDSTALWVAGKMDMEYHEETIYTPEVNVALGTWYYASYLLPKYNNNEVYALAAYNAGSANVDSWETGIIEYKETEQYINKVVRYNKIYQIFHPWRYNNVLPKR